MSDNLKDIITDAVKEVASNAIEAVEQKVESVVNNTPEPKDNNETPEGVEPKAATEPNKTSQSAINSIASAVMDGAKQKKKMETTLIAIACAVVAAIVLMLVINPFNWKFGINWNSGLKIENTANIVEQVKKISEFTTACYYEERVLKADRDDHINKKNLFNKTTEKEVHNEIILTVKGTVRAGFDLSKLGENDMVVRGDTITINLPQPEIFDVISNPSDYKIFEEEGKWSHEEIVEIQSNGKMETLNNALHSGILAKANHNGKTRIRELFMTFGFNVVNVVLSEVASVEPVAEESVEAPAEEVAPEVEAPVEESVEALAEETEADMSDIK